MQHGHISTAVRSVAAIVVGYGLASAVSVVVASLLPLARAEAVLIGTYAGLLAYVAIILWVFAAPHIRSIWAVFLVMASLLGLSWLLTLVVKA